jgi:hypothetical protein
MYADEKLGAVNAVQTLSRVNRTHPAGRGQSSLSAELFPGPDVRNKQIVYQGELVTTNKNFRGSCGRQLAPATRILPAVGRVRVQKYRVH